ncbi:MAG: hypothetical protein ACSLE5_03415 [Porticoccaceae bacterium]
MYDFLTEIGGSSGMKQATFDGLAFAAKSATPVFMLIGLTNLYRVRRRLLA